MMKYRNTFPVVLFLTVAYSTPSISDEVASDPVPTPPPAPQSNRIFSWLPPLISRIEFYASGGSGKLNVQNIPDFARTVTRYNGNYQVMLPDQTNGTVQTFTLALGLSFAKINWLELMLGLTQRDCTYSDGRTTWSEISFSTSPYSDFVGYVYNGGYIGDLSIKAIPLSFSVWKAELLQLYFKAGVQKHYDAFSSGTDAWNTYGEQNHIAMNGYSYSYGGGVVFLFFNFEYAREVLFTDRPKIVYGRFQGGLNVSLVTSAWCKKSWVPRFLCWSFYGTE